MSDLFEPEELWRLDVATGELALVRKGRIGGWGITGEPGQTIVASWAPDSRTVVYGDSVFGLDAVDIRTGKCERLLPPGWGNDPKAGLEWVAFRRTQEEPIAEAPLAVVSRDGRHWGGPRGPLADQHVTAFAWDRPGRKLALVTRASGQGTYRLLVWDVRER